MAYPLRLDLAYLLETMKVRSHHPYCQLLLNICSVFIILEIMESMRRCKHGQHQGWTLYGYLSSSTGWLWSRRKHRGPGSKDTSRWGSDASLALQHWCKHCPLRQKGVTWWGEVVKGCESEDKQPLFDERGEGDTAEKKTRERVTRLK